MTTAIQKVPEPGALAAQIVIQGDLSHLSDAQLSTYYVQLCESMGLNPTTRPFALLKLNGKLMMYALKDCSDQLRKRDKVSITIVSREQVDDLLVVTARATLPDGRVDESIGALPLGKLQGEARANALMKCETKAKRRVTLSICGLGFMDESEVEGAMATDNGANGETFSPHAELDQNTNDPPKQSDKFDAVMKALLAIEEWIARSGTVSYQDVLTMREQLGSKAKPTELAKQFSALRLNNEISPSQAKEFGKLWNRLDRQVMKLEGTVKPTPVEASFVDPIDDDTDAFAPTREPGEEG